ncbi:MAG: riboflavin biosynthesis protein RibF [Nannocystaceae bacterium]
MARIVEQRDPSALPPGTAVCLGAFDGMHLGHQALLQRAKTLADHVGVVTFDPHPQQVLAPHRAPTLLQTPTQRRRVCAALGVEHLVLLPFDRDVAQMSAETFVQRMLIEGLRPSAVVVGEDFRFGRGREGDGLRLAELLAPAGITVAQVAPVAVPEVAWVDGADPGHKLGATAVRHAVRAGQVERAGAMLGRWHSAAGTVVHGAHRGRTIGVPTANIQTEGGLMPPAGVYAGVLAVWGPAGPLQGKVWGAAANLGRNPTFQPQHPDEEIPLSLEAHVIDERLGEQLYGLEVELSFVARLRDEQRFDGPDALLAQLRRDVAAARERIDATALARVITPWLP